MPYKQSLTPSQSPQLLSFMYLSSPDTPSATHKSGPVWCVKIVPSLQVQNMPWLMCSNWGKETTGILGCNWSEGVLFWVIMRDAVYLTLTQGVFSVKALEESEVNTVLKDLWNFCTEQFTFGGFTETWQAAFLSNSFKDKKKKKDREAHKEMIAYSFYRNILCKLHNVNG